MRLIDADAFKNQVATVAISNGLMESSKKANVMLDLIDMQPTAYDLDNVVEELKCDRCESCSLLEICAGSKFCGECHKKIIEIVKQGGVSEAEQKLKEMNTDNGITE